MDSCYDSTQSNWVAFQATWSTSSGTVVHQYGDWSLCRAIEFRIFDGQYNEVRFISVNVDSDQLQGFAMRFYFDENRAVVPSSCDESQPISDQVSDSNCFSFKLAPSDYSWTAAEEFLGRIIGFDVRLDDSSGAIVAMKVITNSCNCPATYFYEKTLGHPALSVTTGT